MQEMRPQAEQEMPQWQRDALDRERSRPRNIDDVLKAIESLRMERPGKTMTLEPKEIEDLEIAAWKYSRSICCDLTAQLLWHAFEAGAKWERERVKR